MHSGHLVLIVLFAGVVSLVAGGTKGDEADVIIQSIMANYKSEVHPNSHRNDGAVNVKIAVNPLSISIVSLDFKFSFSN